MSVNKVNIKEANEHLKQLHKRVIELENQVQMHVLHTHELERTNADLERKLQETQQQKRTELLAKDTEISDLTQRLDQCQGEIQVLLEAAEERDQLVVKLETKARLFYEAVEHRAALCRIVQVLEDLHKQKEVEETPGKGHSAMPNRKERENSVDKERTSLVGQIEGSHSTHANQETV